MKTLTSAVAWACVLCGCAAGVPDHFHVLSVQPQGSGMARTVPTVQATLKVTLPSLVDRPQVVLNTSSDSVAVLEHERWAAPLPDLVTQTLAQDIERRRSDLLVGVRSVSHSTSNEINITVDIVQMWAHPGARSSIETHWRIVDRRTGTEVTGGGEFNAPLPADPAAIGHGLSEVLGLLADRLAEQIPK
jgi:uncharacterized protein